MSTPDLPLYGQLLAYGISAAAIGFAFKQAVQGFRIFFETLFWLIERIREKQ